jgi:hypothetical protein
VRYSLQNPFAYTHANINGHLSVLEAGRALGPALKHVVYASSSSVYGEREGAFKETDPVDAPVSLYAATKRADELMSATYTHLYGLPLTGLRFFTVYGPWGRPDMAYFSFAERMVAGRNASTCSTMAATGAISPSFPTFCRPCRQCLRTRPGPAQTLQYRRVGAGRHAGAGQRPGSRAGCESGHPHGRRPARRCLQHLGRHQPSSRRPMALGPARRSARAWPPSRTGSVSGKRRDKRPEQIGAPIRPAPRSPPNDLTASSS